MWAGLYSLGKPKAGEKASEWVVREAWGSLLRCSLALNEHHIIVLQVSQRPKFDRLTDPIVHLRFSSLVFVQANHIVLLEIECASSRRLLKMIPLTGLTRIVALASAGMHIHTHVPRAPRAVKVRVNRLCSFYFCRSCYLTQNSCV